MTARRFPGFGRAGIMAGCLAVTAATLSGLAGTASAQTLQERYRIEKQPGKTGKPFRRPDAPRLEPDPRTACIVTLDMSAATTFGEGCSVGIMRGAQPHMVAVGSSQPWRAGPDQRYRFRIGLHSCGRPIILWKTQGCTRDEGGQAFSAGQSIKPLSPDGGPTKQRSFIISD
ncbi:hypothetical protein [Fulvimarina sp. MAC8]|uniref:hypothetical protein n=1 Tax=Fulvimarina sp. MAC8 TaxID=3162874 RepID=UPI0032EF82C2